MTTPLGSPTVGPREDGRRVTVARTTTATPVHHRNGTSAAPRSGAVAGSGSAAPPARSIHA